MGDATSDPGEAVLALQQEMAQQLGAIIAHHRDRLVALIQADDPEIGDDEIGADVITPLIDVAMAEMVHWIGPDENAGAVYAIAVGQIATVATMLSLAQQESDRQQAPADPAGDAGATRQ